MCCRGQTTGPAYWRSKGWANLKLGKIASYVMHRRHWPDSRLPEFMADLAADPVADAPPLKAQTLDALGAALAGC